MVFFAIVLTVKAVNAVNLQLINNKNKLNRYRVNDVSSRLAASEPSNALMSRAHQSYRCILHANGHHSWSSSRRKGGHVPGPLMNQSPLLRVDQLPRRTRQMTLASSRVVAGTKIRSASLDVNRIRLIQRIQIILQYQNYRTPVEADSGIICIIDCSGRFLKYLRLKFDISLYLL